MDEINIQQFEQLLQKTLSQMETSDNTNNFCAYFRQFNVKHSGQNAIIYEQGLILTCTWKLSIACLNT